MRDEGSAIGGTRARGKCETGEKDDSRARATRIDVRDVDNPKYNSAG